MNLNRPGRGDLPERGALEEERRRRLHGGDLLSDDGATLHACGVVAEEDGVQLVDVHVNVPIRIG